MSTEKSAILVVGWTAGDFESLSSLLEPIAAHFNIEHDNDLSNVLVDEYPSIFKKHIKNDFVKLFKDNYVELVSGSDNHEDGDYYFGFGIKHISDPIELMGVITSIYTVLNKAIEGIDMPEPKLHNVIEWY